VLDKGQNGAPIKFATIGDTVYHKWTCDSTDKANFCMTVHSCIADDGQGMGQQLVDERGCSLDSFLLKDLNYDDGLTAGQEAQVFKFADKPTIFFSCTIRLELKEDSNDECIHPSEYCTDPRQESLPFRTQNRVSTEISKDFPRPPANVSDEEEGEEGIIDNVDELVEQSTAEEYMPARKIRQSKRHVADVDVSTQSVDILDFPEYGFQLERGNIGSFPSSSNLQVCVSRISLGFILSIFALLVAISILFYIRLSPRMRKIRNTVIRESEQKQRSPVSHTVLWQPASRSKHLSE
ncbi:hypothetical protein V3C99_015456, partial [Haemonchus contortus]